MTVRIYHDHIVLGYLTESQKDYIAVINTFCDLYVTDGICRIYGDVAHLYVALLMIADRYPFEILQ